MRLRDREMADTKNSIMELVRLIDEPQRFTAGMSVAELFYLRRDYVACASAEILAALMPND
jgi:hypothetical protein